MKNQPAKHEHGEWLGKADHPQQLAGDAAALFRYWAELAAEKGAPSRSQIDPLTHFPRLMPTTILVGVEQDAKRGRRYRYRIVGTELRERAGQPLDGRYIDECFPPEQLTADMAIYGRCVDERLCYWGRRASIVQERQEWESYNRIILPILDQAEEAVGFLWVYIWFDR